MRAIDEMVTDFIAHYASQYYDPAKAREYYLRTRELKGRPSASGLESKEQKDAWNYTKTQIDEAKKNDIKGASEERAAFVQRAREAAQAAREDIRAKLTSIMEALTEARKTGMEDITEEQKLELEQLTKQQQAKSRSILAAAQKKIDALPPIPEGVSPERRARLVANRDRLAGQIRGAAQKEVSDLGADLEVARKSIVEGTVAKREDLSAQVTDRKGSERESATAEREVIRTELKATVEQARANYEDLKKQIVASYEDTAQREYDAIKANV